MLDISVVLAPEPAFSDAYNGPRRGDASLVSNGLWLGEVMLLILAQINCNRAQG